VRGCNAQNLVNGGVRILSTGGLTFLISKGLHLSGWAKLCYSSNDCPIAVGQYKVSLFLAHAARPAQDSRGGIVPHIHPGTQTERVTFLANASMITVAGKYM